ncbi:MAG: hypothetical protein BRC37_03165 [Cyanobacteria bacterium QH_3_48_40]|nr:MAG: hypothetical protein BRC37_03165 [Cyanobacteria bacterium QH_3_48_40]
MIIRKRGRLLVIQLEGDQNISGRVVDRPVFAGADIFQCCGFRIKYPVAAGSFVVYVHPFAAQYITVEAEAAEVKFISEIFF